MDDKLLLSYVVRHLGFVDLEAGRRAEGHAATGIGAAAHEVGHLPGVAAGLLAMAQFADEVDVLVARLVTSE